jgi:hypothetical protein
LKKTAPDDTFAREFQVGENFSFAARLPLVMFRLVFHLNGRVWQKIPIILRKGLHNILQGKFGKTFDKSRFSGNKSLHEENDLMKKTFDDPCPRISRRRKFPVCHPSAASHVLTYFSSPLGEHGRKICLLDAVITQDLSVKYGQNP